MAATRAQQNKSIRQEALREQLSAQGHVQQAVVIIDKLTDLSVDLDSLHIQRLNIAMGGHFKLINKYLPELKASEMSLIDEDGRTTGFKVEFTNDKRDSDTSEV